MSQNQLRRAVFVALLLSLSLASLPVRAWVPSWERPALVAETGEEKSFLRELWDLVAGFWEAREKEGVTIDPNGDRTGADGDEGMSIDPDGAP